MTETLKITKSHLIIICFISDVDEFWGRGDAKNYKQDKAIKPFKIAYSADVSCQIYEYLFSIFLHCSLKA